MEALSKNLERIITSAVKEYTKKIVELCEANGVELTVEDLMELWSGAEETAKSPVKDSSKSRKSSTGAGCPYEYSKGDKKGTVCGVKPKAGGDFCAAHEKYKDKEPKQKKVLPQPKKPNRMLVVDKSIGKLVHQDSGLVFKSAEERVVIGRLVDKKVQPIDEDAVELAKKYGFPLETKKEEDEEKPKKAKVVEEEEDEQEKPKEKKTKKEEKPKTKKPSVEDEEEEKPKKSSKKAKETSVEEEKPKGKKTKAEAPAKQAKKTEADSDEEEEEKPKGKKTKAEAPAKQAKKTEEDSDEEVEIETPKKESKSKKTPDAPKKSKGTVASRKPSEDSLDDAIKDLDDGKVVSKALGLEDEDVLTDDD